ncbi:hypothetical protein ATANTOWER_001544 [Ataeniobius toweri]|uniref:Immunoglobulin V-set domain-containing protein n=1 Tax=Ataeniobius toweri TaxID=208326 RepID=A0ABU7B443_9TELE|nr:hypothetical protein [Ataeniobius toweri]
MNLFLLLLHLTSTFKGTLTDETPPPIHEMEEEDNFTLRWDSLTQTNMSVTNMICFLLLSPPEVLYEMLNGAEVPVSQDGRFSGRVHCDRDALREGRLRLYLSRLRTEDSGSYRCDLLAGYNQMLRRWDLKASVNFVLNVTKTSHGDSSVSLTTPKPEHIQTLGGPAVTMSTTDAVLVTTLLLVVCAVLVFLGSLGGKCKDLTKDSDELVNIRINKNEEMNPMINYSADRLPSRSAPDVQDHFFAWSLY